MREAIEFDSIEPILVPVKLAGKQYALREADGLAAGRYRDALIERTKLGDDGKPTGFQDMAEVAPLLVADCLFEATLVSEDQLELGNKVTLEFVEQLPDRILRALYEEIREISELGKPKRNPTQTNEQKSI